MVVAVVSWDRKRESSMRRRMLNGLKSEDIPLKVLAKGRKDFLPRIWGKLEEEKLHT